MYRLASFLLIIVVLSSCSKDDPSEFMWEKTKGSGTVYDTKIVDDTLFLLAGTSDSKPLFLKSSDGGKTDFIYAPELTGAFTAIAEDGAGYYLAGTSGNELLITHLDLEGAEVWDTLINVSTDVQVAQIDWLDSEYLMVIGSSHPDSLSSSSFELVIIDTNGDISEASIASPGFYTSITGLKVVSAAEIFVSITKNYGAGKSLSSVARITSEGSIIWETELFNNPSYAAASNSLSELNGMLYISGSLERIADDEILINSFVASLTLSGILGNKEFLENSNSGSDTDFNSSGDIAVLNRNCLILSIGAIPIGEDISRFRVLDACDSYNTATLGLSLSADGDGNYLIGGSLGGKFYYALRSGPKE
ncbi:MAG: hypothetical protein QNK33_03455 [Bacteroidales bacterium]|nr:hypothetical protein [Bacteroidales bacterium]